MSTTAGTDRKRKPSDVNPGGSPVSKHIKVENTGAMASAGMTGNPAMAAAQRRAQLQQLLNAQQGMPEDTKHKYMSGLEGLRAVVEKNGVNSQEGQAAQNKYDAIVNKLRNNLRQQIQAQQNQQQQQQQGFVQQQQQPQNGGMANNGAIPGAGPNVGAPMAGGVLNPASRANWIVPSNVPPANADQWRTEIQAKLTQVGQKMNHARAQIGILQQNHQQPGTTPEQQRDIQNRIAEHTQQYNHFKEIINKFGQQQKMLSEQKHMQQQQQAQQAQQAQLQQQQIMLQAQQARVGQQQGQQGQIGMQKPVQQGIVPEAHNPSQQQGMMQQQQANTSNNTQQNPQNHLPQQQQQPQQPLQTTNPMQQPQPQPQRPPQQQPQQNPNIVTNAQQQQQRIATPIQRADSPTGPIANATVNRATMSPAAQQPPIQQQQPTQQPQQPQQQGQAQAAVRPPIQPPQQQQQQQPAVPGRSSVPPVAAGTPMAQPNSPAPRAGSVQPARPPTAVAGTPVSATSQQPGQPQPQGQPQQVQQQRMQPASSASAASPTTNNHPTQITRDTAQGHRLPIPKSLAVAAPQPISMPAARPTLSGGMNSSGNQMMSTPAIIKQPAFEFDEGGMGLLSRRKLEELVKQIDPEEKLDPDVEESILELVDEFIDNIATTACKMAKLRGSDTLDIKDIQIILERNWNIRIPGYAADDIRTVRKFNPAPGYHQKMAALAAQKQLNQTAGKGGD